MRVFSLGSPGPINRLSNTFNSRHCCCSSSSDTPRWGCIQGSESVAETLRRLTYVTTAGFLAVATFTFALQVPHRYSRVTFALSYVLSVLFVPTARLLLLNWARRFDWWAEPVVVVGTGQRATRAIRNTLKAAHLGYRPVAVLTLEDQKSVATVETVPVAGDLQLGASFASAGVRVALLETDQFQDRDLVDRLQQHFHHVVLLREFDDLPIQGIHIRNLGGSMVGLSTRTTCSSLETRR